MNQLPFIDIKTYSKYLYTDCNNNSEQEFFIFNYSIKLCNLEMYNIKLLGSYLKITDSDGKSINIKDNNIINKNLKLIPGIEIEYTNNIVLKTIFGTIHGYYIVSDEYNNTYHINIPVFSLSVPYIIN